MATFASRLKDLRASLGISQEELARRLKVTRSCIGNYEQGKREPSYEDLERLADFFNCDMGYLIGKTDIIRANDVELLYGAPSLSTDERAILESYRRHPESASRLLMYANKLNSLTPEQRSNVMQYIDFISRGDSQ